MKTHESAEDYLETILVLKERIGMVRSIDVVNELGYSKPSISNAMKRLREQGYIVMDKDGYISLTDMGEKVAKDVYERHCIIAQILILLGVDDETAFEDACRVEHVLSKKSFELIKAHYEKYAQQ